jgi:hypothetical protein
MKSRGKGRRGGVIGEHSAVIKRDAGGKPLEQKGPPQGAEVILGRRVGGANARIALHLQAADHIHPIDQHDLPNTSDECCTLSIQLPLIMRADVLDSS